MPIHDLAHYGLSANRGYLAQTEIDEVTLPDDFAEVEEAAATLSELLTTGRVRHFLSALPIPDIDGFLAHASEAEIGVAMVRYSFLAQAYVWGEPTPPEYLPVTLAAPLVKLSDHIGFPPVMNYAGYVLDNWYRVDKSGGVTLDNIAMDQNFFGGQDENWFVLVHVAIEAVAGRALDLAVKLVRASDTGDAAAVEAMLVEMNQVWDEANAIFDRMIDKCDPYIYYNRVRPYIHGWKNNPAMDALFQVVHTNDELREFLADLHQYRPRTHRTFIEDLQASSRLRDFARGQSQSLKDAFNACVEQVARFRSRHLEYAASYINKQASSGAGNDPDVGTGGTPFMKYLKKHRDENRAQTI